MPWRRNALILQFDGELLQVIVGLNIVVDGLLDHVRSLLPVLLNPFLVQLLIGLGLLLLLLIVSKLFTYPHSTQLKCLHVDAASGLSN